MIDITIYGKCVGVINDSGDYVTHRNKKHFFKKFSGFGLSFDVINKLKKNNCNKVVILYETIDFKTIKYVSNLIDWYEKSQLYKDGLNDYQRILNIKHIRVANV